jgi:hypothetical protein
MNKKLQSMYESGGLLKALLKDPAQAKMAMQMLGKQGKAAQGMAVNKTKLGMPGTAVPGAKNTYGGGGGVKKYRLGGTAMYANGGQNGPPGGSGPSASQMLLGANTSPQYKAKTGHIDTGMAYSVVPTRYELKKALAQMGYSPETISNMHPNELREVIEIAQGYGAEKIGLNDKRGLGQTKAMDEFIESGRVIANSYVDPEQTSGSGRDIRNQSRTAGVSDTYYDQYEAEEGSGYAAGLLTRDLLEELAGPGVDLSELEVIEPKTAAGDFARGRMRAFSEYVDPSRYDGLYNKYPGETGVRYIDPFQTWSRSDEFNALPPAERNRSSQEDQARLGIQGKRYK